MKKLKTGFLAAFVWRDIPSPDSFPTIFAPAQNTSETRRYAIESGSVRPATPMAAGLKHPGIEAGTGSRVSPLLKTAPSILAMHSSVAFPPPLLLSSQFTSGA